MKANAEQYDCILAGGRVVCPASGIDSVMDVAVKDGVIAKVAAGITADCGERLDCAGKIVTPGLIDAHVHVYTSAHASLPPDRAGVASGAATVVDGGSAGYTTFSDFRKRDLEGNATDIYAYLHHNPMGQVIMPEVWSPARIHFSRERVVETIKANRDRIIGLKDRLVGSFIANLGIKGVERAKEICAECGIPYIVHIGIDATDEAADFELDAFTRDLLRTLSRGDIIAHVCTAKRGRIFRADGAFDQEIRAAYERGVIFDCCCGATNFAIESYRLAKERGFLPHTISTDITAMSVKGPARNLGVVMSKFLALGAPLSEVIKGVTSEAARSIGMADRKGSLAPGRKADITVSELLRGEFPFLDRFNGMVFTGTELFAPRLTFVGGKKYAADNSGGATMP